jgi:hypothetical protein
MSYVLPLGAASVCHNHMKMLTSATIAPALATSINLTVSARKKTAVPMPASIGNQLGPGNRSRYSGAAWIALVTIVSRSPVAVPGK